MKDIVKRLRGFPPNLHREAANTIDTLRQQICELAEALRRSDEQLAALRRAAHANNMELATDTDDPEDN